MKNKSFSILMTLLIALPFLACSLPQDSLNPSQQVLQQKRIHQDMNVSLEELVRIMDVQFSPDGTLLAIATDIGILLYNTKTYDNPEILKGHTGNIWSIAFRPDGKVLASSGRDETVRLWDVNTRQQIKTFGIDLFPLANIVFSPDGKMLASGGMNGDGIDNAYLWDADTGKRLRTFPAHPASEHFHKLSVMDVAFSPDGKVLATTGGEHTTLLWDVNTGQQIRSLTEPIRIPPEEIRIGVDSPVVRQAWSVAFSPDGNMLVTGGSHRRGSIDLWDVNTGQQIRLLTINAQLEQQLTSRSGNNRWTIIGGDDVAFSPDGNTIACTGTSNIHLWDADSGQYHRMLHNAQVSILPVNALAFSPDGKTIACSGYRTAHVWDVKREELIRVLIDNTSHR